MLHHVGVSMVGKTNAGASARERLEPHRAHRCLAAGDEAIAREETLTKSKNCQDGDGVMRLHPFIHSGSDAKPVPFRFLGFWGPSTLGG